MKNKSVGMLQLTSGYFTAIENDYLTSICERAVLLPWNYILKDTNY
jgi:hypothetical protein